MVDKERARFEHDSKRLLRLQILTSVGIFVGLFLTTVRPETQNAFFGLLLSFVLSSITNLVHLYAENGARGPRAIVSILLFITLALVVASVYFAIQTLGGN